MVEDVDKSKQLTVLTESAEKLAALEQVNADLLVRLKAAREQVNALARDNQAYKRKIKKLAKRYLQARYSAGHDYLTGLPHRRVFEDRLKWAIVQSPRRHKAVALLFLDLDKFKNINDNYGHTTGDRLLQLVAERLTACIRRGDTACRYGGDEFIVMLPEVDGQESAEIVIGKIRKALSMPYSINGQEIKLTISIGVATYLASEHNIEQLICQADIAMYRAKKSGCQILRFDQQLAATTDLQASLFQTVR